MGLPFPVHVDGIRKALNTGESLEGMARGLSPSSQEQTKERVFGYVVRDATEAEAEWFQSNPEVWAHESGGSLIVNPSADEMQDGDTRKGVLEMAGAMAWIRKHRGSWDTLPEPTPEQRQMLESTEITSDEMTIRSAALGLVAGGFDDEPTMEQRQFVDWMRDMSKMSWVMRAGGRRPLLPPKDPNEIGEGGDPGPGPGPTPTP